MYRSILAIAFILLSGASNSQTLFTYGNYSVDVNEFMRAFNKVSISTAANKEKAIRTYLDLYITSKLKIREAMNRGYDTLPAMKDELVALRTQIIDNYMSDQSTIDFLINEAFQRSQKDISVSHIFIPYKGDTTEASSRAMKAYGELVAGKKFEEVVRAYSADQGAAHNNGNIGYITLFSLPYEFENIVYSLGTGKFSTPYRSSFGYHIFRNNAERKAIGRMRGAHILFAYPPGSDDATKKRIGKLADSVYQRIKKGEDFTKLALEYSNDYVSNASGGQMKEVGTGVYDPVFENALFSLQKNGDISAPFATSHGYHIVQRIALSPISAVKDKKTLEDLKLRIQNDSRINLSKQRLYERIISQVKYTQEDFDMKELFVFADSLIDFKRPAEPVRNMKNTTVLFKLGDKTKTAFDYVNFAINNRFVLDGTLKPNAQVFDEFKVETALEYYRDHLEEFNVDFRNQMNDFKEGNLFFEIMMQEIWGPAQNDSIAQRAYYEKNRSKFAWKSSADAVVFFCSDESVAKQLHAAIRRTPTKWKELSQHYGDKTTIDSGRFEMSKIPGLAGTPLKAGTLTPIVRNPADNSTAFAYVLRLYPKPAAKTFIQAKSDVIAGYQEEMEAKWVAELRKKYPVKVNEAELKKLF